MARILFFNPPSKRSIYTSTNVSVGAPHYPNLTLAALAGHLVAEHDVRILDLDLVEDFKGCLFKEIDDFKPEIVASTANTPDYLSVKDIMGRIKKQYKDINTIVGGVHITALPEDAIKENCFDFMAVGEGDTVIPELLRAPSDIIPGVIRKGDGPGWHSSFLKRNLISCLDDLPFPAWDLYSLKKYKHSRLSSRKNPVGLIETSRGCAYQCNFCNKLTFGNVFRVKQPKRVVDEMEYMLKCGFKEIHIADDSFTQDIDRARDVCNEIIKRGIRFPWSLLNGVRVDKVDYDFFKLAKKSGCWQVGFGLETGDQNVLNDINKSITIENSENAIKAARKAGVDTFGFFILGLKGDTEESIKKTIEFSKKIPLDIAKFDICIPYPGTPYYKELKSEDRILSCDWTKYNCHQIDHPLFKHPNLTWESLSAYYKKAFREFYLRPTYVLRRLIRDIRRGDIFSDVEYCLKTNW